MGLDCDKQTLQKNYVISEYLCMFDGLPITECSFLCQKYYACTTWLITVNKTNTVYNNQRFNITEKVACS